MTHDIKGNADNNIEDTQKTYLTSEASKMIGIAPTTIRKYAQSLQEKGYLFLKGKGTGHRQARLFTEKDITVLRYLKEIREDTNITVERATSVVIERFGKGTTQDTLPIKAPIKAENKQHNKQHDELKEMINKQSELLVNQSKLILNLTERLDKQEKYIIDQLAEQTKPKEIEAQKEDETFTTEPDNNNNKGFFARLFNK